ncbi:hypothetical protein AK812_SmicGene20366 [Symbiodinium microadriaticum]|uniref:Uncharacterized protein n=1 Tax=Symbiodinium microadriaticum TaxID=2951 RepID=A0A1Q9DQA0_SYMMI|nr:hypothetical protein AK812_SmicGene20366 [Symbiodinium microadriaticum]
MSTCLDFAERTPIAICDVERSFITFLEPPDERCANRGRSRLVYLTDDGLRGGPSNCKRLWPAEASRWSKVSSGGPSLVSDCSGCSQGPPNAILAMASCTATDNVPHQPRLNVGRCCADGVHGLLAFQPEQVTQLPLKILKNIRAYGVLAQRQPARGARNREELLALVAPAAPDFCSEDYESLRPSAGQLRVARDFASARRDKRDPLPRIGTGDGAASASEGGDERCVAAQSFAVARCSANNEVEAATVAGVNLRSCCARQPLLRHDPSFRTDRFASDLDPRHLNDETTPGQQAGAWAGEVVVPVCIDLGPTAVSAFRAAVQGREGQGQPKAAPHCDVHQVGRKGGSCVRRNRRKPHARAGLKVKEGASGRSQGRKQHALSKGSVKCENGVSLPTWVSQAEFTLSGRRVGAASAIRPLRSARPALCRCARSAANAASAFQRWFRACRVGAAADSPANFHAEDNQLGEAPLVVSPWAGLAIPPDWAHDCGIHRDLGALPNGESIGDNLDAASVAGWYVKVEDTEADVRCRKMVAVLINASTAGIALRSEWEGQAESAEDQDSVLRVRLDVVEEHLERERVVLCVALVPLHLPPAVSPRRAGRRCVQQRAEEGGEYAWLVFAQSGSGMSPSPPASNVAKQRMMAASCLAAKTAVSAGGRVRGKYVLRSRAAGATRTAIQAPEAVLLLQSLGELRGDEVAAAKGASQDHHALLRNWEGPVHLDVGVSHKGLAHDGELADRVLGGVP